MKLNKINGERHTEKNYVQIQIVNEKCWAKKLNGK